MICVEHLICIARAHLLTCLLWCTHVSVHCCLSSDQSAPVIYWGFWSVSTSNILGHLIGQRQWYIGILYYTKNTTRSSVIISTVQYINMINPKPHISVYICVVVSAGRERFVTSNLSFVSQYLNEEWIFRRQFTSIGVYDSEMIRPC